MKYCTDVNLFYEVKFKSKIGFGVSQKEVDKTIELAIEEMKG